MGYGVTAYYTHKNWIKEYVFASKDQPRIESTLVYQKSFYDELNSLTEGHNCIRAQEAVREIIAGQITRKDPFSGAIYWYVLEKLCVLCDVVIELPNQAFYPVSMQVVSGIFRSYPPLQLPFPQPDDFPLIAYIPNDEIKKLQRDCSHLKLPLACKQEFEHWLTFTLDRDCDEGELILYYY